MDIIDVTNSEWSGLCATVRTEKNEFTVKNLFMDVWNTSIIGNYSSYICRCENFYYRG